MNSPVLPIYSAIIKFLTCPEKGGNLSLLQQQKHYGTIKIIT